MSGGGQASNCQFYDCGALGNNGSGLMIEHNDANIIQVVGGDYSGNGDWGVCDPNEPKNRRTRCGLLLQKWSGARGAAEQATTVLIDTPPELRQQLAAANVARLDAVILSHDHADQINGFDDVRAFFLKQRATIPVWLDEHTRETFMRRFGYTFISDAGYPAILQSQVHAVRPTPSSRHQRCIMRRSPSMLWGRARGNRYQWARRAVPAENRAAAQPSIACG